MSEKGMSAEEVREIMQELARASVHNLQKIFTTAPMYMRWEDIEERLGNGEQLKDICHLSDEYMERLYQEGKEKLGHRDYAAARERFATLCVYDQQTPKYWSALAKSCEGLKLYEGALDCYRMLTILTGGSEPLPYIAMGHCHLMLKDRKGAREALEAGREICDPYDESHREEQELITRLIDMCK